VNTLPQITLIQDIMSLPKVILEEICTDLDLDVAGYKGELANRIFEYLQQNRDIHEEVLQKYSSKIFAGKTSLSWFRLNNTLSIGSFKELIKENHLFDPFENINVPSIMEITTDPILIGAAEGFSSSELFLRMIYKSGIFQEVFGTEIRTIPKTSLATVYYNEKTGILEIRGDSRKAESIAKEIARLLNQQINLEFIESPFNHRIGHIADDLKGELIDTTSKPEIILEEFDEDQIRAVANVLTALDEYFDTNDTEQLANQLEQANSAFGDQEISIPFSALILAGMDKVGLGGEREIRGLPLFDYLNPNLQEQGGFIRFSFIEDGVEKSYTVRVGIKSRSIYFTTPATEKVIAYVRENVIM